MSDELTPQERNQHLGAVLLLLNLVTWAVVVGAWWPEISHFDFRCLFQ
jgi:hypothetical protein